ncbi:acyl-CoA thioesterase [Legionella brunensis]|uniref:Esterase n=1 Tax=Legionella brunensis TaxID=29422 RepID=A0A0W0SLC5_9GAMM|nr:acyl-CoA thioesterase [Legionella brunensis]KTC83733.1 hypothetical protein Lbru_1702 [Legionella brunensis]
MEKIENNPPSFKLDLPVRIYDINYGGHLGHAELVKITHQARLMYFDTHSLNEANLDGAGVIAKELHVEYKGEAFFNDLLHISISLQIEKASCIFLYNISKNDNKPVALVKEKILFMDYSTRKLLRVPECIKKLNEKLIEFMD